jgi:hypothetical protein
MMLPRKISTITSFIESRTPYYSSDLAHYLPGTHRRATGLAIWNILQLRAGHCTISDLDVLWGT